MNLQHTKLLLLLVLLLSISCASTNKGSNSAYRPVLGDENFFLITELADDSSYGYTQKNPIKVGGAAKQEGPLNERRFLNGLAGPNGEEISFQRLGSCCAFNTKNGFSGSGMLDRYEVVWAGQKEPVILYINMYDYDVLKIPIGFSARQ